MYDTPTNNIPTWTSSDWLYIKELITKQINDLRLQNDNPMLDEKTTTAIRGKIAAFKQVVELPETMRRSQDRREQTRHIAGEE